MFFIFILPEDRATLESKPERREGDRSMRPYFYVRPFPYFPYTLVYNALNSGGMGAAPHYNW